MDQVDGALRLMTLILTGVLGLAWLALGLVFRINRPYATSFFFANLCIGSGVALVAQRAVSANFLTIQIADWLVIGGITAFWSGVRLLTQDKPSASLRHYVPIGIEVAATIALPADASSYYVRAVVFNVVAAFTALLTFFCSARGHGEERVSALIRALIAAPFLFAGGLFAVRALHVVAAWMNGDVVVNESLRDYTPYLWAFIVVLVVINISNTGMVVAKLMARLNSLAIRDALTGCLNRRAILDKLHAHLARSERHGVALSCILFDLDHFKQINDQFGHEAGDAALVHAVAKIREKLRSLDEFGRYGGEEFILLMPDTALSGAYEAANRMRLALDAEPFVFRGTPIALTASFGVAQRMPHESQENFLRRADLSMYEAKQAGRNRVISAGPDAREPALGAVVPGSAVVQPG